MDDDEYEAKEGDDIAGKQPAEKEPVQTGLYVVIPSSHRAHPPARSIILGNVADKVAGGDNKFQGHRNGKRRQEEPGAPSEA